MATNNAINTSNPITVGQGGSGVATMTTAYAPVCAGTTATGALQVASTGLSTSGWVLTSTGASSLPTFQAVSASSGLTWISSVTASSSATVDFANKLSSTYDNYLVVFENVVAATQGVQLRIRVGTGGTPTYQTSSYNGMNQFVKDSAGSFATAFDQSGTGAVDIVPSDSNCQMDNASTNVSGGYLYVTGVNTANNKCIVGAMCLSAVNAATTSFTTNVTFTGQWQTSTVLTSLRFLMSSGNIATGTFKLYGIQN